MITMHDMLWAIVLTALITLYFYLQWYQLRYFFEAHYIATGFSETGINCKRLSVRKHQETTIQWKNIDSCILMEGFDSSRWWYTNVKQRFGMGTYNRLVIQTKTQETFVFHPMPKPTLPQLSAFHKKISAFDSTGEILHELEKHHVAVQRNEVSLFEATTNKKKDWYRNS